MNTKVLTYWALGLVLLCGILFRVAHLNDQHRLTPNERTYLYYANRIQDEGIGVNKALYAEYINDPDMWAVAPPVRIGYVVLLNASMSILGTRTVEAGMAISLLSSVLTLLLVAWMGLRFFNPQVSLIASALCATAFTEVWLVRGTPQDGVFGLFGLLEILIACEIMRAPKRYWLYVPLHLIGIWSILMKQSGVFIYVFLVLWLIGFLLIRERNLKQAIVLAVSAAAGLIAVCGILVALAGDSHSAWKAYQLSFLCNDENWAYQDECCFGPWTQMPIALFLLSPLTFGLSIAGVWALANMRAWGVQLTVLQRNCGALCALMAVGFAVLFTFYPKMQILRYLTPGDGAICLVAALGLWALLWQAQRHLARIEYAAFVGIVAVAVAASMIRDYGVFNKIAMQAQIPELGAALIRSALGR